MTGHGVLLFHTTSAAMRAEKVLTGTGCPFKLIPTPRQFSSDCGVALRFDWDERELVVQTLQTAEVEFDGPRLLD